MNINSLLCSLLAAYACGASGTYENPVARFNRFALHRPGFTLGRLLIME